MSIGGDVVDADREGESGGLPERAYAVALASLPSIGPSALRRMLEFQEPSAAWKRATLKSRGDAPDVAAIWKRHTDGGIHVLTRHDPRYPKRLPGDPQAPPVLFCLGNPESLNEAPTVALVGTRSPTRYGIGVAAQLAAELSAAGVSVVSGLALGIDAAAHEGACGAGAPPIGVVAGGLDEPYPRRHARLWTRVAEHGVMVSESPAGAPTERWRFPVRNRLMASLSDVVVVVESRHHGGSRHTVDAAIARGVTVGAVPGSIRSTASEGTNALLAEGAFPVCSTADVLMALSLAGARLDVALTRTAPEAVNPRPESRADQQVLDALAPDPAPLDALARATGLGLPELCGSLERLAQLGLAHDVGGYWARA